MSVKEIRALIKEAYFFGDINIGGNAYELPAGKEWELESKLRMFLSDWEFLKKYRKTLKLGKGPARNEFSKTGMYNDSFYITLYYRFVTYDGGVVTWSFQGSDDAYGNLDVIDETSQSRLLGELMHKTKFEIEVLYRVVTGKSTY